MTILDSAIFGPLFVDPDVTALFTDRVYVRALVTVEVALARVQARLGIIPIEAAERIASCAEAEKIDLAALASGTLRSGFPVIALVRELQRLAGRDAGRYVHWGATTQDVMDCALMLQLREARERLSARLDELISALAQLADRHRETVMAARTHSQQAVPITFGLKVANWLLPLVRHRDRLDELSRRLLVVQFGGAAGTLAALGARGLEVMEGMAAELGLGAPPTPWHTQRDHLAELAGWLGLVTGSVAKMAQDVILLAQTEVGEVAESGESGRGGSSTMPQKNNPVTSELIVAAARANAALLSAMYQSPIQEHERGTHGWQLEWLTLPQMIVLAGGALKHGVYLATHLRVDPARMRANVERAGDTILAEAAAFALAGHMSREEAEALVKEACARAESENRSLLDALETLPGARTAGVDWRALMRPENYLGEAGRLIDRALEFARRRPPA